MKYRNYTVELDGTVIPVKTMNPSHLKDHYQPIHVDIHDSSRDTTTMPRKPKSPRRPRTRGTTPPQRHRHHKPSGPDLFYKETNGPEEHLFDLLQPAPGVQVSLDGQVKTATEYTRKDKVDATSAPVLPEVEPHSPQRFDFLPVAVTSPRRDPTMVYPQVIAKTPSKFTKQPHLKQTPRSRERVSYSKRKRLPIPPMGKTTGHGLFPSTFSAIPISEVHFCPTKT